MSRMPRSLTKQRSVLGVRMGKQRPDWAKIGNVAVLALGVVSAAVGGARALQNNLPKREHAQETGSGDEDKAEAGDKPEKSESKQSGS